MIDVLRVEVVKWSYQVVDISWGVGNLEYTRPPLPPRDPEIALCPPPRTSPYVLQNVRQDDEAEADRSPAAVSTK